MKIQYHTFSREPYRPGKQTMRTLSAAVLVLFAGVAGAAQLILPSTSFERDATVVAVFRSGSPVTGKGTLSVEWTDALGRVVESRSLPVTLTDETDIRFLLNLRRAVAMANQVHAHLSLAGVNRKGAPDNREENAEASFVARPPARTWEDYEVMMWQPHTAEQYARFKEIGINAGQHRGRDHAPPQALLQNDMRWYAENLATDFYSEYHRYRSDRIQNWSWLQAKELWKMNPDSLEPFKRHPSLSDPLWLDRIRQRLIDDTQRLAPYRPIFYDLGDESGIADLAGYWDFDFSDQSLSAMREWLQESYGTLAALNRQWGTSFANWESVTPETTSQAMRRADDNYSSWADHKEWMDIAYARALEAGAAAIHSVDPQAYVAIAGGQMPGWGGYDYYRLTRALDAIEPYDIGSNIEMIRSFSPGFPFVTTSFARGPWEKHRIWFELLHGAHGNIIWDEKAEHIDATGEIGARGHEVEGYYKEIRGGLGALLIHSVRQSDPVAIHYSQASMRTEWMLAQRPKGDAWVNRTSSTERLDSDFLKVRESYCRLVEDLGLQYNFIAYAQVEQGQLLQGGYRVLILPRSSALSSEEVRAIREFANRGGLVIADGEPGVYDEHSRRRAEPPLTDLFDKGRAVRMNALDYHQLRLLGKEAGLLAQAAQLTKSAGVEPPFAVTLEDGKPVVGVETHRFRNGDVTVIGLLSNPQQRVDELGPPEFKSNQRFERTLRLRLSLPTESSVYDLRSGTELGRVHALSLTLEPYEPRILAVSAAPLPRLRITAPAAVSRGDVLSVGLAYSGDHPGVRPVVHLELIDPAGRSVSCYSANLVLAGRFGARSIPLALNDPAGRWTVRVRDMMTGQVQSAEFEVR